MIASLDLIVSIQPEYARKIMSGQKTVELRRRFPQDKAIGRMMFIYSSKPEQAIIGVAYIENVRQMCPKLMWDFYQEKTCVSKKYFFDYFSGVTEGFGIELSQPVLFKEAISINELREEFSFFPPQSFRYLKDLKEYMVRLLEDERIQIPDRHKYSNWPRRSSQSQFDFKCA